MNAACLGRKYGMVGLLLSVGVIAAAQSPDMAMLTPDQRERFSRGSDLVLTGDFAAAARTLERLRHDVPEATDLGRLMAWVDECNQLRASRERLREKIFEYHRDKALEHEKAAIAAADSPAPAGGEAKTEDEPDRNAKWKEALGEVYSALQNTDDEDGFRQLDWVTRIASGAARKAAESRRSGESKEAFILYELLRLTFPENEAYEREARECRRLAHFAAFYTKKKEWQTELRNIQPSVVREILARVSHDYVREPDFKKLTISALENVALLGRTPQLHEIFPTLKDRDRQGNFVDRIDQQLGKVRGRKRFDYKEAAGVFENVMRINRDTVELPDAVMVQEFVTGLLEPLDDFTSVIWPSSVSEFTKHTRGEFVGVGISIQKDLATGFIRVESPLPDTPAYEAGIAPGEFIVAVDGRSAKDLEVDEAVDLITGEPGTKVTLTIRNLSGEDRTMTLTRRRVKIFTVAGVKRKSIGTDWDYLIDEQMRIGYVRVSSFMEQTVEELKVALEELQRQGCRGLILDLRFNPGGLLKAAIDVSELFLNEGEPIVMTKGRSGKPDQDIKADPSTAFRGWPIIVLVNEASASASEIVSGALSGRGKACIVGTRTYGKGLVQNLIPIEDGAAFLKLTTQYYYVPNNDPEVPWRCLHRETGAKVWGVDPDITVKITPYEARKVIRLRRRSDVLKAKGASEIPAQVLNRRPTTQPIEGDEYASKFDDHPDVDVQLLTALNVMRTKLLSRQPWVQSPKVAIRDPLTIGGATER